MGIFNGILDEMRPLISERKAAPPTQPGE